MKKVKIYKIFSIMVAVTSLLPINGYSLTCGFNSKSCSCTSTMVDGQGKEAGTCNWTTEVGSITDCDLGGCTSANAMAESKCPVPTGGGISSTTFLNSWCN
jgi:hypothetical protein